MSFYKKYNNIITSLRQEMNPYRYEHSIGVMHTAACLSMRYNIDIEKAMLSGLLHDCTKHFTTKQHIELCKNHNIILSDEDLNSPGILHAITAPIIASDLFDIHDFEILSAIRWHTTGRVNMTNLEKLIYTSDFIEGGRSFNDNTVLNKARKIAFNENLDRVVAYILKEILIWLKKENGSIHSETTKAANYYN